jgi:hypothetical protein
MHNGQTMATPEASLTASLSRHKSAANAYPVDPTVSVARTRRGDVAESNRPSNETNTGPCDAAMRITDVSAVNDSVGNFRGCGEAGERRNCDQ